jgi:hypothetical protein
MPKQRISKRQDTHHGARGRCRRSGLPGLRAGGGRDEEGRETRSGRGSRLSSLVPEGTSPGGVLVYLKECGGPARGWGVKGRLGGAHPHHRPGAQGHSAC